MARDPGDDLRWNSGPAAVMLIRRAGPDSMEHAGRQHFSLFSTDGAAREPTSNEGLPSVARSLPNDRFARPRRRKSGEMRSVSAGLALFLCTACVTSVQAGLLEALR